MSSSGRIELLDQLRGLAAISVAWFHLTNGYSGWVGATGSLGWLGVEAFFVISGFVIPSALNAQAGGYTFGDFPQFFARRAVRLEPPYLVSIAIVVGLDLAAASTPWFRGEAPDFSPMRLLSHVGYITPLTQFEWIQPVYWTLAYEFCFYISIGLLFPIIGTPSRRWFGRIAAAGVIGLVAVNAFPHVVALFVMGFLAFRGLSTVDETVPTLVFLGISAAAILFAGGGIEIVAVGISTALLILFHRNLPALPSSVGVPLGALGTISYSLYLVHVPIGGKVVNLGTRLLTGDFAELFLSMIALGLSLTVATCLWYLIEQPSLKLARRIFIPRMSGRSKGPEPEA